MIVQLYTTLGCHLCEQAHELLLQAEAAGHNIDIELVEISESEELMALYGIRIPVVKIQWAKSDIGWPFNLQQLLSYLHTTADRR